MTTIINFEGFLSEKNFEKIVIPTMKKTGTPFSYYKEDFESMFILEKNPQFFVFLRYIPNKHHTHYPTLEQSIKNELGKPRQSKGEWVVETIYQVEETETKRIFKKIDDEEIEKGIIGFVKNEILNH